MKNEKELVALFRTSGQSQRSFASSRGIPEATFRAMLARNKEPEISPFSMPELPTGEMTAQEIIDRSIQIFDRQKEARDARKLINVKVNVQGPIGLTMIGDPHIDNRGTFLKKLVQDLDTIKNTEGMFAGCVGDVHDNWVGRLAALYANSNTTAKEAWLLVEWFFKYLNWLFIVQGNHDCLDMETEVLTDRGWLKYDELTGRESVLSMDTRDGSSIWHPIIAKFSRENTEDMIKITSQCVDQLMTIGHRVLHRKRNHGHAYGDFEYCRADTLPASFAIPVSAINNNPEYDIPDDVITLVGWILTDGSISNTNRMVLWQSKECPDLDDAIDRLGFEYSVVAEWKPKKEIIGVTLKSCLPARRYDLSREASDYLFSFVQKRGKCPEWAGKLSARQFEIFINAIVSGDGTWDGLGEDETKNCAIIHGTKEFLDSLQAVCVSNGWSASLSVAREKDYRLNICKRDTWKAHRSQSVERVSPVDRVWCLTVPFGNFMVRRNGKSFFTGNCWNGGGNVMEWIARQGAMGPCEPHKVRLCLNLPSGRSVRINARHDFSGRSQWNTNHGPSKAVQMGIRDHIVVAGHTHASGHGFQKDPMTGLISHPTRIASYKIYDDYADRCGFEDSNIFCAPVFIIDPQYNDDDSRFITFIPDTQEGADYLTFKRKKAGF